MRSPIKVAFVNESLFLRRRALIDPIARLPIMIPPQDLSQYLLQLPQVMLIFAVVSAQRRDEQTVLETILKSSLEGGLGGKSVSSEDDSGIFCLGSGESIMGILLYQKFRVAVTNKIAIYFNVLVDFG